MANKFILLPDEIYRGLTSSAGTGDINLDFIKQNLDRVKRQHGSNSSKNINYNQELRRYLHLRKEKEQQPINVAVSNSDAIAGALFNQQIVPQPKVEINNQQKNLKPAPIESVENNKKDENIIPDIPKVFNASF